MVKHHCFPKSIISQAVYFKLRFSLSYRYVEEMMAIRGVKVDHATIQRWVFKFTCHSGLQQTRISNKIKNQNQEIGQDKNSFKSLTALAAQNLKIFVLLNPCLTDATEPLFYIFTLWLNYSIFFVFFLHFKATGNSTSNSVRVFR